LLHKPVAKLEIAGDIDERVMNFLEVLRTRTAELVQALQLTPWHEGEFRRCLEAADDALEDARRFFVTCWSSIKGGPTPGPTDFRWQKTMTRRSSAVSDVARLSHPYVAAARLANVQFLVRDALEIIESVCGTGCLIYFDPPYVTVTRTRRQNGYRHEFSEAQHIAAAELLLAHNGPVVVSGYASTLYESLYERRGWQRVERQQATNSGGRATECLWLSPLTVEQLSLSYE